MSVVELQKIGLPVHKKCKKGTRPSFSSHLVKCCDVIRVISKGRSKACIHLPHINKFKNLISNQHLNYQPGKWKLFGIHVVAQLQLHDENWWKWNENWLAYM